MGYVGGSMQGRVWKEVVCVAVNRQSSRVVRIRVGAVQCFNSVSVVPARRIENGTAASQRSEGRQSDFPFFLLRIIGVVGNNEAERFKKKLSEGSRAFGRQTDEQRIVFCLSNTHGRLLRSHGSTPCSLCSFTFSSIDFVSHGGSGQLAARVK
jgi:hypothetical protein